jgi:hypothetical protein
MRSWGLAIVLMAGAGGTVAAQPPAEATAPFKRANAVLLYAPAPAAEVLRALAENLRLRGFELDSVDYEGGVVTTRPTIPPGTESWPLVIRLVKIPGGVRLTGRMTALGTPGPGVFPAEFWGFDSSPAKKTFREVEATARQYGGGQVRYSRLATPSPWRK